MAWYMPSYGRPARLRELLEAPGGWPSEVEVLVNVDDPQLEEYHKVLSKLHREGKNPPWIIRALPAGSRCADAHRWISSTFTNDDWYGLLCDDQWPVTPKWHERLVEAAGKKAISTPNGEPNFPKLRNALVIGGDIARAMGSLVPIPVKHNFEDNVWDDVAETLRILRPLEDVVVEHRHWIRATAERDATYERGSADFESDKAIYWGWKNGADYMALMSRVGDVIGAKCVAVNTKDIVLHILVPIQDEMVDLTYHKSIFKTLMYCQQLGIHTQLIESGGGSNVGKARERLLWDSFYRTPRPTHQLWIDADMGWEPEQVTRLLASGHEFAAIAGVRKQDDLRLCANFLPNPQVVHDTTKFLKVRDVGFAFVMLKTEVIDKLTKAYPDLKYRAPRDEWALFMEMIHDGDRLSEDFSFCRRWTDIGGEIWLDFEEGIKHVGKKAYTGRVADLFETGV